MRGRLLFCGLASEGCQLETVAKWALGWHVKPSPSHMALPICSVCIPSGVMKSVGKK
jgi:hypothetical protein